MERGFGEKNEKKEEKELNQQQRSKGKIKRNNKEINKCNIFYAQMKKYFKKESKTSLKRRKKKERTEIKLNKELM